MSNLTKILLSAAVVGTAAAVAGVSTFATFTDSDSTVQAIDTGTVAISLGDDDTDENRLNLGADGLVPGDSVQRRVVLTNDGDQSLASITLTTTALPSSILDTDAIDGLHMTIRSCSVPWVESGTSPAFTYTCAGATTELLANRAVIGANIVLPDVEALAALGAIDMVLTVDLPLAADNRFQSKASTITYTFTATQRGATNK